MYSSITFYTTTQSITHPFILLKDGAEFAGPGECGLVEGYILRRERVHIHQVAQLLQGALWKKYYTNGWTTSWTHILRSFPSPPPLTHIHTCTASQRSRTSSVLAVSMYPIRSIISRDSSGSFRARTRNFSYSRQILRWWEKGQSSMLQT